MMLEILPNHFKVVPVSVPMNILQRMATFPLKINICARKVLRWLFESPFPMNDATLGIKKWGGICFSMICLVKGCPSSRFKFCLEAPLSR